MAAKFTSPDSDHPCKHIISEEDHLSDNDSETCYKALNRNRKPGWDGIPIEGYDGSQSAKLELFSNCSPNMGQ